MGVEINKIEIKRSIDQQITEEIKKEIKICIETNENENTTTQNLWDTVKSVLRGKFIAIQAYLKKQEKSQINNLTIFPHSEGCVFILLTVCFVVQKHLCLIRPSFAYFLFYFHYSMRWIIEGLYLIYSACVFSRSFIDFGLTFNPFWVYFCVWC